MGSADAIRRLLGSLPPSSAAKTAIATTGGTYRKARALLDAVNAQRVLDYGAGRQADGRILNADTFEPFVPDVMPTYRSSSEIPSGAYDAVTSFNVLNVLQPDARAEALLEMRRALEPGGRMLVTVRNARDVMGARGVPGLEPNSLVIGQGDQARYQKGFENYDELDQMIQRLFSADNTPARGIGGIGILVRPR